MIWRDDIAQLAIARGKQAEADPPPIAGAFPAVVLDAADSDETACPDLGDWQPGRLAGAAFGIEYLDAKGSRSVRRITALKLRFNDGAPLLACWCHERRAYRSFRLDRIQSCHDRCGEVFETQEFLRVVLGIDFRSLLDLVEPEDVFGNGMRLLSALAYADGGVHLDELERIIQYCVAMYDYHAADLPKQLGDALPNLVRSQRPTSAVVDKSLRGLRRSSASERNLFARYAVEVMDADGVHDPAEFALVQRMRSELQQ